MIEVITCQESFIKFKHAKYVRIFIDNMLDGILKMLIFTCNLPVLVFCDLNPALEVQSTKLVLDICIESCRSTLYTILYI
jgi:hypothetical protein